MKKTLRLIALAMVAVMLCLCLASCFGPNKDPDKAEKALEKAGYEVESGNGKILEWLGMDGLEAYVTGYNEDEDGYISIYYFEDKESAEDAFKDIEEMYEDLKEEAEEEGEKLEFVFKKSGKIVYFGTKNAVKAAK